MDWIKRIPKLTESIKKYRYIVLVLMIGLVLMMLPGHKDSPVTETVPAKPAEKAETLSSRLSQYLSQIEGAGKVSVLLTEALGEETVYQTNSNQQESGTNSTTVLITDAQRNQNGLVQQKIPPVYLGAIILCQGADSPAVRLAITEAVARVTGLGTDCISVLKMK